MFSGLFVHKYVKDLTFDQDFAGQNFEIPDGQDYNAIDLLVGPTNDDSAVRYQAKEPLAEPIPQPEVQPDVTLGPDSFFQNNQPRQSSQPAIPQTSSRPLNPLSLSQTEMNSTSTQQAEISPRNRKSRKTPPKTLNHRPNKRNSPRKLKHQEQMRKRSHKIASGFQKIRSLLDLDEDATQQVILQCAYRHFAATNALTESLQGNIENLKGRNDSLLAQVQLLKEKVAYLERALAKSSV